MPLRPIFQHLGSATWLLIDTVREMGDRIAEKRSPFRVTTLFEQAQRVGVGSVPLVALVSLFLGMTMALLIGYQLEPFGTERLVPTIVAVGFTRELGPLITGIMVAARIGAAFTAELGTMSVSDEVEAIEGMGIGPLRFLVGPRILAAVLLLPCLAVVACVAAVCGAAAVCMAQLEIALPYFFDLANDYLLIRDIVAGLVKSFMFGLLIGLIACYKGLGVRGGAAGVGEATTSSVVISVATVIGSDTLANVILINWYD